MRFAIIGCGSIGAKRRRALSGSHELVVAADKCMERARSFGVEAVDDWRKAVEHPRADAIIVATSNDALATIARAAVEAGKPVLVEKPCARSVRELDSIPPGLVQPGFNHRYHPALQKARELVDSGALGPLMFVRGRYGHGGRSGYEKEWRANPAISGGGELIDQGVHLIDLARWFLGDFNRVDGHVATYFWDMPVDDNAFLSLRNAAGQTAWLHVSCTEWKNLFSLEIYGRDGKLHIEGLGGSYGTERIAWYRMLPQMGPPETVIWEFPGEDMSWRDEIAAFAAAAGGEKGRAPTIADARAVLEVVERIYDHHA